jgi:steroid delta-isomerase-like uncharacterized protein
LPLVTCEHVRSLIERFYDDAWNRWDDDAVDAVLAEEFVFRGSLGDEARGRDGFRAYRAKVRAAFPDFHNEICEMIVDGDRAAVRLRCTGRHEGEFLGFAASGAAIAYDAAAFFTVGGGRLTEAWVLGDLDRLRRQLTSVA